MFYVPDMDWAKAIDHNQTALARIVAALFAMVGLTVGGTMERPPNAVRLAVLRILRPAESAVRRLIVIAAHGLAVKLPAQRSWPAGRKIAAKGSGTSRPPAFKLFDSRKRFEGLNGFAPKRRKAGPVPRITFIEPVSGYDPRIPMFKAAAEQAARAAAAAARPLAKPRAAAAGLGLARRLQAIAAALSDIPKEALRLARWRERRARNLKAKFQDPVRIGKPPGHRKTPVHEVDGILNDCHSLALNLPPAPAAPPPPNTS
jgi:hypothetical protein